ncbi:DUF2637 domain-containing protein [Pseudofrankia sp. BMG5.37]|uniref:DUF2637 domain-containing protein n=1 Tax=Pseudofrankia sp. BMG5.37 TaxID=3050035 RepID=UPI002895982E|nr:DUF2637 domain-containing protein [Pseudofrankia sp. BMG5.37]MDT3446429.1 DUF2637 domain-containing protein [Pseudofrankia sp. BMG5.37]
MFDAAHDRAMPRTAATDACVLTGTTADDDNAARPTTTAASAKPAPDGRGLGATRTNSGVTDLTAERSTTQSGNCDSRHLECGGGATHVPTPASVASDPPPRGGGASLPSPADLRAGNTRQPGHPSTARAESPLFDRPARARWWRDGEAWIRLATVAAVLTVAGIAAAVSYRHMRGVALGHGEDHVAAAIIPVSVDGLIVAASMTLLADSRAGRRRSWLPYALLILGSAASLAANVMHAEPDLAARVIAAWPPVALIGGYELLMSQIRATTRPTGNRPVLREPGRRRHRAVAEQAHRDDVRHNHDHSPASTGKQPDDSSRAHDVKPASACSARSAWPDGNLAARTEPASSCVRHPAALADVDDSRAFGTDVEHRWTAAAGLPTQRAETRPGPAATGNPSAPSTDPPDEFHAVTALNGPATTLTDAASAARARPVGLPSDSAPACLGEGRTTGGTASADPAPLTSKKAQLAALLTALPPDDPRTPYALARDLAPALDLHEGTARRYIAELRKAADMSAAAA